MVHFRSIQMHDIITRVTVKPDPAGTLTGTVTDATTGAPVPEICVTVAPVDQRADRRLGRQR